MGGGPPAAATSRHPPAFEDGWSGDAEVGREIVFRKERRKLRVFRDLHRLADRKLSREKFLARLEKVGLDDVALTPRT